MFHSQGAAMKSLPISGLVRPSQTGLSLVELLVAMALGLFLMAGIAQVYLSSKQSFRVQDALSRIQENGRFAMDQMSRDIRNAGYKGACVSKDDAFINTLDTATAATANSANFAMGIQGYEYASSTWSPTLDVAISGASPAPQASSDILTVRGSVGGAVAVGTPYMGNTSADIKANNAGSLKQGQIIFICDGSAASIFQITNANPTSGSVVHNTGNAVSPGNATKNLGHSYGANSEMTILSTSTYYLAPALSGTGSALWRLTDSNAPVEVIDGVQDMQITYGVDSDADHTSNSYLKADAVNALTNGWANVISVRMTVLLRSPEDNLAPNKTPYTYNATTTTPTDLRVRRIFTSTVTLRNRNG